MKNQVLSIDKMQKLKDLGIDTRRASMCWLINRGNHSKEFECPVNNHWRVLKRFLNPCNYKMETFTLQDILNILPFFVEKDTLLHRFFINHRSSGYELSYMEWADREKLVEFTDKDPLNAAYNMLVWIIENGYFKY